jgi:hypothetical protein
MISFLNMNAWSLVPYESEFEKINIKENIWIINFFFWGMLKQSFDSKTVDPKIVYITESMDLSNLFIDIEVDLVIIMHFVHSWTRTNYPIINNFCESDPDIVAEFLLRS